MLEIIAAHIDVLVIAATGLVFVVRLGSKIDNLAEAVVNLRAVLDRIDGHLLDHERRISTIEGRENYRA